MNWMHTVTIVVHVLLAAAIVGLVLLQRGRGADAGAGFGAGASGTVFGARGSASFLSRSTATLAGLFIVTSLILAYLGGRQHAEAPSSVVDKLQQSQPAPSSDAAALPSVPASAPPSSDSATQQPVESPAAQAPAQESAPASTTPQSEPPK